MHTEQLKTIKNKLQENERCQKAFEQLKLDYDI
jgi:hypothetical protein